MFKRLIQSAVVIAIIFLMAACGNKGDLFLSPDVQLAIQLEAVSVQLMDSTAEISDDEVFDVQKQVITKP